MSVVQVDAFETPLHGRHIRWFVPSRTALVGFPPGFEEQINTESPPYKQRMLIMSPKCSEAWKLFEKWDAVFVPHTSVDWSLILTWLQKIPPTTLVVLSPDLAVPLAFFQKCKQLQTQPTLIHFQYIHNEPYRPLQQIVYDDTFFPQLSEQFLDTVQGILQSALSADILQKLVLKDVLNDLRAADAALVISYDTRRQGGLYWYYVTEQKETPSQLLTIVQAIAKRHF